MAMKSTTKLKAKAARSPATSPSSTPDMAASFLCGCEDIGGDDEGGDTQRDGHHGHDVEQLEILSLLRAQYVDDRDDRRQENEYAAENGEDHGVQPLTGEERLWRSPA